MAKIRIIIADNSYLTRKGLEFVIANDSSMELVAEAEQAAPLMDALLIHQPDVLIIDHTCPAFPSNLLKQIFKKHPKVKILAVTNPQPRQNVVNAINSGVTSYLLKECDREEIIDAIIHTARGEKFLCAKVLGSIAEGTETGAPEMTASACDGVNVSDREMEIIKLVAEGFSNKQIADKLFLSAHTVTTHRKNIMAKLNINNTAGLVLYAVRHNLLGPNHFLFSSNN